ncbi:MAG: hypothetical protein Unbinned7913contig1002_14 [Prokaryotic dsDNA virus sp.]|nr:MAG: hypothetical protein Unbinned7913contig1002_14 [Prokaryotic dsDNA virus sp.]
MEIEKIKEKAKGIDAPGFRRAHEDAAHLLSFNKSIVKVLDEKQADSRIIFQDGFETTIRTRFLRKVPQCDYGTLKSLVADSGSFSMENA